MVFAAVAGVTIAALLRYVFGSIDQNLWGVAGGLTLGVLAAGLSMLGLGSLFGRRPDLTNYGLVGFGRLSTAEVLEHLGRERTLARLRAAVLPLRTDVAG